MAWASALDIPWCRRRPFRELIADGEQGIEAGHGLLEDHAHFLAPHLSELTGGHAQQFLTAELDAAAADSAVFRQQSHDRKGGNAFAAAAFAHHAKRFVFMDLKGNIPDYRIFLLVDPEGGYKIFDFQNGV